MALTSKTLASLIKSRRLYIAIATKANDKGTRYLAGDDRMLLMREVEKEAKAFGLSFEVYEHIGTFETHTATNWKREERNGN